MTFESTFMNPGGRISRGGFIAALVPLLLAAALYAVLVKGRTGLCCLAVLLVPAVGLHARRLHDMGQTAWLLIVPAALDAAALWLPLFGPRIQYEAAVTPTALAVSAAFVLWGAVGKGRG